MNILIIILIAVIIGLTAGLFILINKKNHTEQNFKLKINTLNNELEYLKKQNDDLELKNSDLQTTLNHNFAEIARMQEQIRHFQTQLKDKEEEITKVQDHLKTEFKNLSNELLNKSTESLNKNNRESLDQIVKPLQEKLQQYNQMLSEFREKDIRERSTLTSEIKQLHNLNRQLSEDAQNLASALKNDSKLQGNWGELILERILERAGLQKNITYKTQVSTQSEAGKRIQPDVVVFLPDNRHLIIDSKVSLTAFEELVNATNEQTREAALQKHISSVKKHIKSLTEKRYETGEELNSPEFIFLFMPVENALSIALQYDETIQNFAWENRIVLVTPSTLMATLMTVANLWKIEKQHRFAQTVADETGKLYDKFVNMLENVNDVGQKIDAAQKSHEHMVKQLSEGKGNLISKAEKIREMGISHKKSLPSNFEKQSTHNIDKE